MSAYQKHVFCVGAVALPVAVVSSCCSCNALGACLGLSLLCALLDRVCIVRLCAYCSASSGLVQAALLAAVTLSPKQPNVIANI